MITYDRPRKKIIWQGRFEDRYQPKNAGLTWDPKEKEWFTCSPYNAYLLRDQADTELRGLLSPLASKIADSATPESDDSVTHALGYLPFQTSGIAAAVKRLKTHQAVAVFDDQGLGKTIQAIGVLNELKFKTVCVVCPASLRLNWKSELEKWWVRPEGSTGETVPVLTGKAAENLSPDSNVIISYDLSGKILGRKFDLIIIDECHKLKNKKTERSVNVLVHKKAITKNTKTIVLSGTPLPNGRAEELFNVLSNLAPDVIDSYPKYWDFVRRFCILTEDEYGVSITGTQNHEELGIRLRGSGFMVRRMKSAVLKDLPPKRYSMVLLSPTPGMRKLIKREAAFSAEDIILHGVPVGSGLPVIRHEMGLAKVPMCLEFIENLIESGTEKLVVFAYHKDVIQILCDKLAGYGSAQITGSTPPTQRQDIVMKFQDRTSGLRILIGQLQAAGEGFTMTAAHDVVMVERSWVPGENDQVEDRLHRIGQNESVMVYDLVVQGSIDAAILKASRNKKDDSDKITK